MDEDGYGALEDELDTVGAWLMLAMKNNDVIWIIKVITNTISEG